MKILAINLTKAKHPEKYNSIVGEGGGGVEQLQREIISSHLEIGNEDFVDFLAREECQEALERDGISIHVPTGQIFVRNENNGESIFDFLKNQQDENTPRFYI